MDEHAPDAVIVDVRMPPTHTDEGLRAAQAIRAAPSRGRDRDPLADVEAGHRAADPGRAPGRARLPAQGPRHRHRGLRRHAAPRRRRRLARSTRRSSTSCSPARPTAGRWRRSRRASARCSRSSPRAARTRATGERLGVTERAVQKHVTAIFDKLGLTAGEDDNRRILAVLTTCGRTRTDARRSVSGTPRRQQTPYRARRARLGPSTGPRNPGENPPCSPASPSPSAPPRRRRRRARDLVRRYGERRHRRRRAARRLGRHRRRPPDRGHGPVGLGQVDAHAHPRRARQAHLWRGAVAGVDIAGLDDTA